MNLINLQKASNHRVQEWIENSIKDLTPAQKDWIINEEIIRFAPFYFMERRKKTRNILLRFSILFIIPILLFLIVGLPFNFCITGNWGYDFEKVKWFSNWTSKCGL
jgi:hypothetical protein